MSVKVYAPPQSKNKRKIKTHRGLAICSFIPLAKIQKKSLLLIRLGALASNLPFKRSSIFALPDKEGVGIVELGAFSTILFALLIS